MTPEDLCRGQPLEFVNYIKYARSLRFEEKPDYSYGKKLFRSLMIREGLEYDLLFDWVLLSYLPGKKIKRRPTKLEKSRAEERQKLMAELSSQQAAQGQEPNIDIALPVENTFGVAKRNKNCVIF